MRVSWMRMTLFARRVCASAVSAIDPSPITKSPVAMILAIFIGSLLSARSVLFLLRRFFLLRIFLLGIVLLHTTRCVLVPLALLGLLRLRSLPLRVSQLLTLLRLHLRLLVLEATIGFRDVRLDAPPLFHRDVLLLRQVILEILPGNVPPLDPIYVVELVVEVEHP